MTLNHLIDLTNEHYEGNLALYWDREHQQPCRTDAQDPLAYFIVCELANTYQADAPLHRQLQEARTALRHAQDQLGDLADDLGAWAPTVRRMT